MIKKFLILFGLTTLLVLLGACAKDKTDPLAPQSTTAVLHKAIAVEIWTDSYEYHYDHLEQEIPIHIRATLTNVTGQSPDYLPEQTLLLHNESQERPAVDVVLSDGDAYEPFEMVWSQENPDQATYSLTLAPGESYTIEWTPRLSASPKRGEMGVFVLWVNIYGRLGQWGLPIRVKWTG